MPVMKRLTVDGVNYDTVGEASVTQVQTSGTKIATVTIDGTATDLYAPEGGGGGADFNLVPVFLNSSSSTTATVTIPEVGPDDMVTVFSSFGDISGLTADYGAINPYVVKNVNGAVTFKYRAAPSYPLGVLLAVFSNLELQVFGLTSATVSNRKPEAGETVTVSGSSGTSGTYTMYYHDLVTGESVLYATCADTSVYSGSFTMPNHPVYLTNSFSGGGGND